MHTPPVRATSPADSPRRRSILRKVLIGAVGAAALGAATLGTNAHAAGVHTTALVRVEKCESVEGNCRTAIGVPVTLYKLDFENGQESSVVKRTQLTGTALFTGLDPSRVYAAIPQLDGYTCSHVGFDLNEYFPGSSHEGSPYDVSKCYPLLG